MGEAYWYSIPYIPKSMNAYLGRHSEWAYRTAKNEWERIMFACCRERPEKPIDRARVTLTYYFEDKRRHDPDNYSGKMILDGLVRSKIIADDSFGNIDLVLRGRVDKKNPRTEISVEGI